jgi:hypothetical protein
MGAPIPKSFPSRPSLGAERPKSFPLRPQKGWFHTSLGPVRPKKGALAPLWGPWRPKSYRPVPQKGWLHTRRGRPAQKGMERPLFGARAITFWGQTRTSKTQPRIFWGLSAEKSALPKTLWARAAEKRGRTPERWAQRAARRGPESTRARMSPPGLAICNGDTSYRPSWSASPGRARSTRSQAARTASLTFAQARLEPPRARSHPRSRSPCTSSHARPW